MVVVYHAFSFFLFAYLIPAFLVLVPVLLQERLNIRFSVRDLSWGLGASLIVIVPSAFAISAAGGSFLPVSPRDIVFQLLGVSLPEEVYFRGFLQERMGNTRRGVVVVSLLFACMHLPQLLYYGNLTAAFTFFPSLVMGFLYLRTGNLLPSTIFHFFSNMLYISLNGSV